MASDNIPEAAAITTMAVAMYKRTSLMLSCSEVARRYNTAKSRKARRAANATCRGGRIDAATTTMSGTKNGLDSTPPDASAPTIGTSAK
jgi:hypothetical protein